MAKYTLGLNTIGYNTSASLIKDNKIVAAIEEERLRNNMMKAHLFMIHRIS